MRFLHKYATARDGVDFVERDECGDDRPQEQGGAPWRVSETFSQRTEDLVHELKEADRMVYEICRRSDSLQDARELIVEYLNDRESDFFDLLSPGRSVEVNIAERVNARECIRVFKNILRTENERRTKYSALQSLRNIIQNRERTHDSTLHAFLCEMIALLHGINGRGLTLILHGDGDKFDTSVHHHDDRLHRYVRLMNRSFRKFPKGSDASLVRRHEKMKKRILDYFKATDTDWNDYHWHLSHLLTEKSVITSLLRLETDEMAGLDKAEMGHIPVQITPYYLSLFNPEGRDDTDRAVRAQVIPSVGYCNKIALNRRNDVDMDYMGEHYSSPIEGITRRYPSIVIFKPFNSCPQLCVYCQRNWEIGNLDHGAVGDSTTTNALRWIRDHDEITEVLVTGGDPLTMNNARIGKILDQLADIDHVERIRIGTRTLAAMPCRIDEGFIALLRAWHKPGRRELVIMTHFEHATELTPDAIDAVERIRKCGVSVYNQQVFTYFNSKKFETAFLRKTLKLYGIDPYYTFNTKGKEETADFRVPIARLLQERKEEARLLPGIVRTDEPVFNVPRVGKSHLRAWQDHEPIMVLADGRRVYRFLPWDSRLSPVEDYLYTDVAIYDYLKRLHLDGEDVEHYRSIWYYF